MPDQRTPALSLVALPEFSPAILLAGSLVIALLVIAFAVSITRSRSSKRGNLILLAGNEDAGKSAVLSTIVYERTLPSHTSFQVNSSLIPESFLSKKQLQIVDIPGHPRLRESFKTYVPDAKAVVFVVDASAITRNGREVAEHLHHVLHAIISLPPSHSLPSLLILAHKTDLLTSSSTQDRSSLAISRVRTVLERELEKRRSVAAGGVGVEDLGAEGEGTEMGGLECGGSGVFRFAEWEGGEVGFAASYVKVGEHVNQEKAGEKGGDASVGLDALRNWLEDLP
ncbi:uncharacterized protein FOMMEDRAFT_124808 [Fomitiporia mediterranea MF3/22]|uniref:uncharacterized protein n=1 Tax=Fomitiporia mediterranea (strain MF3/22) TaxID=694068 RepID=UPI0004408385|nr:uncharacterized protein FOMMEDRAFT_124808 [Fomitiporia mediterranea MF3/22]EJD02388.1 hypothetical protein FOMMEDRAFT_124808 [Fomitiporia mediterranea MF3/22]